MSPMTKPKPFSSALLLPVFVLLWSVLFIRITENDIWYHLVIGQEVIRTFRIPAAEFFVYPLLGQPVSFHEWGFGVLFYLAHQAGGYWGMSAVNALIIAATLFFLYLAVRRSRQLEPLPLLLLCLLLGFIYHRLVYRPEMMLFLFLAVEIWLLERFAESSERRWLLPLPLLTMLLSNFHPSSIFLLAVLGFYSLQALIPKDGVQQRGRRALLFTGVMAASFLAAGINPYGFAQVFVPFRFAASNDLLGKIAEFIPTFQTTYKYYFLAICVISLLLLPFQSKRRLADWLIFLSFGWLGYRYARNVVLFALVMYVPVVRILYELSDRYLPLQKRATRNVMVSLTVAALIAVSALPFYRGSWGAGAVPDVLPEHSARMLKNLKPAGQLFNFYDFGGYLAWELSGLYGVAIDGRHYSWDKSMALHEEAIQGAPRWQEMLREHNVGSIVVPAVFPYSGRIVPLLARVYSEPEWLLVSQEPSAMLFVRRGAVSNTQGFTSLDKNLIWRQVMQKSRQAIADNPGKAEGYLSMGEAALMLNDLSTAAGFYRRYLQIRPDDRDAATVLSMLVSGKLGGSK